jgi:hypothetical protein
MAILFHKFLRSSHPVFQSDCTILNSHNSIQGYPCYLKKVVKIIEAENRMVVSEGRVGKGEYFDGCEITVMDVLESFCVYSVCKEQYSIRHLVLLRGLIAYQIFLLQYDKTKGH